MAVKRFRYIPTGNGFEVPEYDVFNDGEESYLYQLEGDNPSDLSLRKIYLVGVRDDTHVEGERIEDPDLIMELEKRILFGEDFPVDVTPTGEVLDND